MREKGVRNRFLRVIDVRLGIMLEKTVPDTFFLEAMV